MNQFEEHKLFDEWYSKIISTDGHETITSYNKIILFGVWLARANLTVDNLPTSNQQLKSEISACANDLKIYIEYAGSDPETVSILERLQKLSAV